MHRRDLYSVDAALTMMQGKLASTGDGTPASNCNWEEFWLCPGDYLQKQILWVDHRVTSIKKSAAVFQDGEHTEENLHPGIGYWGPPVTKEVENLEMYKMVERREGVRYIVWASLRLVVERHDVVLMWDIVEPGFDPCRTGEMRCFPIVERKG
jgi:hypothetical protein